MVRHECSTINTKDAAQKITEGDRNRLSDQFACLQYERGIDDQSLPKHGFHNGRQPGEYPP